jgi:RNase P protein component
MRLAENLSPKLLIYGEEKKVCFVRIYSKHFRSTRQTTFVGLIFSRDRLENAVRRITFFLRYAPNNLLALGFGEVGRKSQPYIANLWRGKKVCFVRIYSKHFRSMRQTTFVGLIFSRDRFEKAVRRITFFLRYAPKSPRKVYADFFR